MSPSPGPPWTQADDDQLRTLAAAGESCSTIAELFKRSDSSIRKRARWLKIKLARSRAEDETKPEEGRREAAAKGEGKMTETGRFAARPWTPADDEVLRSLALKGVDARGIGNRLNRTADAVRSRARRLNILIRKHRGSAEDKEAMGKRSTWTSKDDDQLRALAASGESSAVIAVRLNRTAAGVRRRAMDLGVKLAGSKRELGLKAKGK